ncbi:MAG: hemagglutinin repeat-containing protein, partial [Deltaproteobacteria bacterium]|nr:hemagglutinin repeat-containing protein [Deltaproteobacteria bacterium]
TLNTRSGNDTNIIGANLLADRVRMDVGNNLTVASLQDTSSTKGSSWGLGGGISIGLGKFFNLPAWDFPGYFSNGSGLGGNINASYGEGFSRGRWVEGQTSVIGKSAVDIYVGKNTNITGAVIAADNGNLVLNTDTLTYSDLHDYKTGQNWSAGLGFNGNISDMRINDITLSGSYASRDKEQTSRATVGDGAIIVRSEPGAPLAGLNRALWRAQEITKNDAVSTKFYVSSAVLRELFLTPQEVAEGLGRGIHSPNLAPGAGRNGATVGQDSWRMTDDLDYDRDQKTGERQPTKEYGSFTSDGNPVLQFLYHVIPGFKSSSEIHDLQMRELEKVYGGEVPFLVLVGTIVPSFALNFLHAVGNTLNVSNWSSNWQKLQRSYELRK